MGKDNPNALKHMYDKAFLERVGKALSEVWKDFDQKAFRGLLPRLLKLEMKPRVHLVRDELYRQLPKDYPTALKILLKSIDAGELSGFSLWPFTEFIQAYGLGHLSLSFEAQKKITKVFTAEFSIRPFLRRYPEETLAFLMECSRDKSEHVRRWASEGSRPRLPWGEKLHHFIKHPELTLPILNELCFDESVYVRKSVANHLNDIAKDHPELVIKTLKSWQKRVTREDEDKLEWIIRHSLRTLIKAGDPRALTLIGVSTKTNVKLVNFSLEKKNLKLNERLTFSLRIKSAEKNSQRIVVDYKIHYQKAGGKLSEKVFKLKTFTIGPGELVEIEKSHHVKAVTTRVHYSGLHYVEIILNGVSQKKLDWFLKV